MIADCLKYRNHKKSDLQFTTGHEGDSRHVEAGALVR